MNQPRWDIQKLILASGQCPFDNWFDSLDSTIQVRIDARLDRLVIGNFGDYKSLGDGVFELRFKFGPGYRVYYALVGRYVVLLLVGGDKSSQGRDIKEAQKLWDNYQEQLKGEN